MARTRFTWVYMTAATRREALRIGEALVRERLAACVNVGGPIDSVYRWKGRMERGREVALVAKTRASRLRALTARVKELHAYETPCIVALPIEDGNPDFLRWLASGTED